MSGSIIHVHAHGLYSRSLYSVLQLSGLCVVGMLPLANNAVHSPVYTSIYKVMCAFILQNKLKREEWRPPTTPKKDSQIGQLLLHLLGAHLKRIQVMKAAGKTTTTTPILGLYMENTQVC